jgi:hypothetical protein
MRVERGMVIVRGYGGHKEARVSSSPPEFIARLLLSELEEASLRAEGRARQQMGSFLLGCETSRLYA